MCIAFTETCIALVHFEASLHRRYHKVVGLVDFMAATGASDAAAIVEACEIFAQGSQRQWLKVAGEAKAQAAWCKTLGAADFWESLALRL